MTQVRSFLKLVLLLFVALPAGDKDTLRAEIKTNYGIPDSVMTPTTVTVEGLDAAGAVIGTQAVASNTVLPLVAAAQSYRLSVPNGFYILSSAPHISVVNGNQIMVDQINYEGSGFVITNGTQASSTVANTP